MAPPPMGRGAKIALIAGFLITGSINTLTKKFQLKTCSETIQKGEPSTTLTTTTTRLGDGCPAGEKEFSKPWTQNMQMFFGETLVMGLFLYRRPARERAAREVLVPGEPVSKAPFYIFLLPAACDVLGTGIGGIGMLYISASVWQMMRGSLILFTSILSVGILKKRLWCYNWLAVCISGTGLLLVGVSAILDEGTGGGNSNVLLGIGFTVVSQFFAATQMVVEELFVKKRGAPPEQVVGSEGIWGMMVMVVMLTVMYFIPGDDAGSYENVIDSVHMLTSSGTLALFVGLYLVSIALFNFFGVTIAGKLSAVTRTINDALRTAIVWGVQIIIYYSLDASDAARYGSGITPHSWMQLLGFLFLILGSLTNHAIVKFPCISYPEPEAPSPAPITTSASSSQQGVSLVAGDAEKASVSTAASRGANN